MAERHQRGDEASSHLYKDHLGRRLAGFCKSVLPMAAIVALGLTLITAVAIASV